MNRFTFPSDSDKIYFYKSSQISYTVSRLSLQPVQLPHRQKQKMRIKMNKIFKNIDKLLETDLAKNSIKVIDNCAVINEELCLSCGMCAVKCPRHAIYDLRGIFTKVR